MGSIGGDIDFDDDVVDGTFQYSAGDWRSLDTELGHRTLVAVHGAAEAARFAARNSRYAGRSFAGHPARPWVKGIAITSGGSALLQVPGWISDGTFAAFVSMTLGMAAASASIGVLGELDEPHPRYSSVRAALRDVASSERAAKRAFSRFLRVPRSPELDQWVSSCIHEVADPIIIREVRKTTGVDFRTSGTLTSLHREVGLA